MKYSLSKSILSLLVILNSIAVYGQPSASCGNLRPEWISLGITENMANNQVVTWRTDPEVAVGQAQIVKDDASPNLEVNSRAVQATSKPSIDYGINKVYHRVELTELEPDTKYLYRVGNDKCWSEWFQFKTAKSGPKPFSFIFLADVQYGIATHYPRVIRQATLQDPNAAFFLYTADLTSNATDAEFNDFFWAGDWMIASRPVAPIPDNHEYREDKNGVKWGELASFWPKMFAFPSNAPEKINKMGGYHFDYQNTRFIMINSKDFNAKENRAIYDEWLENLLKTNTQKWLVVAHHYPVMPISAHREKSSFYDRVKPLYDKYGVDLVLGGHDHGYSRGGIELDGKKKKKIQGPVYVVSVAGSGMYVMAYRDWYDRMASDTQLFQQVSMGDQEISFKTYTATGNLYDEFSIKKSKDGSKVFTDKTPDYPEAVELPIVPRGRYSPERLKEIQMEREKYIQRKKIVNKKKAS